MPNKWRTIYSWVHKIRLHGRRGEGNILNPSRDKNEGKHRRRKVDEKLCVTFPLCDLSWCIHKSDVQNKWDDNTTHTLIPSIQYIKTVICVRESSVQQFGRSDSSPE